MAEKKNVALVFGASGISGWAVSKNLLSYPSSRTFTRIIALTYRQNSLDGGTFPQDPRLEIYSGINVRGELNEVKKGIQQRIPEVEEVTHVYYCAYSNATVYGESVMEIKTINSGMTYNAVHAIDYLCPNLKFWVLQTGTNHYGVAVFQHMDKIHLAPPLREEAPRIPPPYGDEIFYYDQVDLVKKAAKGKSWRWCEVRPDQIVGFVPNTAGMTFVEPIALYLSLYCFVNGRGASVSFPGTQRNFTYTFTDSSQDIISKAEIYLSTTTPDQAHGEAFNIADTATPGAWSIKWPILAEYFGLVGTGPGRDEWGDIDVWWNEHQGDYRRMCEEYKLRGKEILPATWMFAKIGFTWLDRDREMSLDKIRDVGFMEELPVGQGYQVACERMAEAGIIPSSKVLQFGA
ncbi:hypothetical protein FQN55_006078 [Onygenales sp. PD_40]|nr:hypothetical protein FQN55_006078 [Onygenales sp. PD_40]